MDTWNWKKIACVSAPAFFIVGLFAPLWFVIEFACALFVVTLAKGLREQTIHRCAFEIGAIAFVSVAFAGTCCLVGLFGNWFLPHLLSVIF